MKKGENFFRLITVGCTIILVFLIVTGCVNFDKVWETLAGLFGRAGAGIRQNIDTVIKWAITVVITAVVVHLIENRKK